MAAGFSTLAPVCLSTLLHIFFFAFFRFSFGFLISTNNAITKQIIRIIFKLQPKLSIYCITLPPQICFVHFSMINVLVGCFLQKKIKRYNFFYQDPVAVIPIIKHHPSPIIKCRVRTVLGFHYLFSSR
jgi:hypothetical protein